MNVRQAQPLGLGHAVLKGEHHVGEEPFAVLLGDDLIDSRDPLLERMVEVACSEPARIFGVYPQKGLIDIGADADLVLVDLDKEVTVKNENVLTRSGFLDELGPGHVWHSIAAGVKAARTVPAPWEPEDADLEETGSEHITSRRDGDEAPR